MNKVSAPKIYEIARNETALTKFQKEMEGEKERIKEIILDYPTVYIHICKKKMKYEVYVGETSDIIRTYSNFQTGHEKLAI